MASLTMTIKHRGGTPVKYIGKDGKKATSLLKTKIEDDVLRVAAKKVSESAEVLKLRSLYLAAIFFQRVCARTPVDEGYKRINDTREARNPLHYPDSDYVRDAWKARCNGRVISAKSLRMEHDIYFEHFNDESEIRQIFEIFKERFIGAPHARKSDLKVQIENVHPRFSLLEYGGLVGQSAGFPKGEWSDYTGGSGAHYHGIQNGYSVQAPYGMLRVTEAEFKNITLGTSTEQFIKNYVKKTHRLAKVPNKRKMRSLKSLFKKSRLTNQDIARVQEEYGV